MTMPYHPVAHYSHNTLLRCILPLSAESGKLVVAGAENGILSFKFDNNQLILKDSADLNSTIHCLTQFSHNIVLSGGRDGALRVHLVDLAAGNISTIHTAKLHNQTVCDITLLGKKSIAISHWDGTVAIYEMNTAGINVDDMSDCDINVTLNKMNELEKHENSTCLLGLGDGGLVTGSAGISRGSGITNSRIRYFHSQSLQQSNLIDCPAPVRNLLSLNNGKVASCDNLGNINVYDDGLLVYTVNLNAILFKLASQGDELILTSEPGTLYVLNKRANVSNIKLELTQKIQHPSTLWSCCYLDEETIASVSNDGFLRVYSKNSTIPEDPIEFPAKTSGDNGSGNSEIDTSKLPFWDDRITFPPDNKKLQLFRRGAEVIAAEYDLQASTWVEIGTVVSGEDQSAIAQPQIPQTWEGTAAYYTHHLPVELPSNYPVAVQQQNLYLHYNLGENPWMVAQRFLDENDLMDTGGFKSQIVEFLYQNGIDNVQTINIPTALVTSSSKKKLPVKDMTTFNTKLDPVKVLNKFESLLAVSHQESLNDQDRGGLLDSLNAISNYSKGSSIGKYKIDLDLLSRLFTENVGKLSVLFPLVDMIRGVVAVEPKDLMQCSAADNARVTSVLSNLFESSHKVLQQLVSIEQLTTDDGSSDNLLLLLFRLFANGIANYINILSDEQLDSIIQSVSDFFSQDAQATQGAKKRNMMKGAAVAIIVNTSCQNIKLNKLLSLSSGVILSQNKQYLVANEQVVFGTLLSVGTIVSSSKTVPNLVSNDTLTSIILDMKDRCGSSFSGEVQSLIEEVLTSLATSECM